MLQAVNIQSINQFSSQPFFILLTVFFKGFLVFTVMYLIITSFKEQSAKLLHLLWFSFICSFILIVVFSILIPSFDLGVLRFIKNQDTINRAFTSLTSPQVTYIDTAQAAEKSSPVFMQNTPALFISRAHWSFFMLTVWFIGILAQLIYFASGKIGLLKLRQNSENYSDKKPARLVKDLSQKMGINRSVLLLASEKCKIPFTCGFLNPVIFLPVNYRSWSLDRLKNVLVHEIAHIKRKDNLTYYLSRIICSIFWYMPFIWVAHRRYLAEQEKACDSYVINTGTAAADYARDVVDIVHFAKRSYLIAAIHNTIGKKSSILKRRVLSILNLNKGDTQVNSKSLVKILVFCMLCALPFTAFTPSMIQEKRRDAKEMFSKELSLDPVYGTWINTDYSGKVWEYVWSYTDLPDEIDPDSPKYIVRYRQ